MIAEAKREDERLWPRLASGAAELASQQRGSAPGRASRALVWASAPPRARSARSGRGLRRRDLATLEVQPGQSFRTADASGGPGAAAAALRRALRHSSSDEGTGNRILDSCG